MEIQKEVQESTVKVYFTSEYGKFKIINGNRPLDENKIKKIVADIENGTDVLRYYPIQVSTGADDRLEIMDGQHRFHIAKMLKRSVHFIVMEKPLELREIATINSRVSKWKTMDYINTYVQTGNDNYKTLLDFLDKYELGVTMSVRLLIAGELGNPDRGVAGYQTFAEGYFEVKEYEKAVAFAEKLQAFKAFKGYKSLKFAAAIHKIIEKGVADMEDLIKKFSEEASDFKQQSTWKDYAHELQRIYNKRLRENVTIF